MTENDIKTGKELLKEDFIRKNPEWTKELEIMVSEYSISIPTHNAIYTAYIECVLPIHIRLVDVYYSIVLYSII